MAELARSTPGDALPIGVELDDVPVLHMASVMLTVLTLAAAGEVTPADCIDRLMRHLACAEAPTGCFGEEAAGRVDYALEALSGAGLLASAVPGGYRITARGRTVLQQHPLGVDESVLEQFEEFRAFLARRVPSRDGAAASAAASQAYLDGFAACLAGQPAAENPHPPDIIAHMFWGLGWFEAMDEMIEHGDGGAGPGAQREDGR